MKNSNNIIGNRTRDLPDCSAVPQETAPPRGTLDLVTYSNPISIRLTSGLCFIALFFFFCGRGGCSDEKEFDVVEYEWILSFLTHSMKC